MAYINTNTQTVARNSVLSMVAGVIADLKTAAARRAVYREVYAELDHMTNRDLADIGISRDQIADVATKAAYGTV